MKYPLDPDVELYRWGPIPGKYFYAAGDSIDSLFVDTVETYGEAWPDSLWLAYQGRVTWLTEFPPIWERGKDFFIKHIVPPESRRDLYREWQTHINAVNEIEKNISVANLERLDTRSLIVMISDFYQALVRYWSPTLFPEMGNYGAEHYLEERLSVKIKDHQEVLRIMEIITAPEEPSFYQLEEVELSKSRDISAHQQKYFWLQNSHNGVRVLPASYFEERRKLLPSDLENTNRKNLESIIARKTAAQKEFGLDDETMSYAKIMSDSIVWQDRRKMNTFISLHYKYLLLKEAAQRTGISETDLFNIHLGEIGELLGGRDFSKQLKERRHGVGVWCTRSKIEQLPAEQAQEYWELYAQQYIEIRGDTDIFSGVIASRGAGIVRGRVHVLLDPMQRFEEGAILVTTVTSPEYVFAMRQALAIITDTGGVGSHAAITSRELNKPCIVGTNIATQVLKDGDLVEVDAEKGIVRVLERA